jgi:hypothetical protein
VIPAWEEVAEQSNRVTPLNDQRPDLTPETRRALGIAAGSRGLAADVLDQQIRVSRAVTDAGQRVNVCVVSFQTIGDALGHAGVRTVNRPEAW